MSKKIKTEHSGAKNGGGFFGKRMAAKNVSNKIRRTHDKIKAGEEVLSQNFIIKRVHSADLKKEITEKVLRSLPNWFGIERAILDYIEGVSSTDYLAAYEKTLIVGFASLKKHFENSYEIYVMGVMPEYHRMGVGAYLLNESEKLLRKSNIKYLQVKTLSGDRIDSYYDQTREFYLKNKFIPLEIHPTLWGQENPCLQLIKNL
jgi:GNAT superfamily N-acetyltransferase